MNSIESEPEFKFYTIHPSLTKGHRNKRLKMLVVVASSEQDVGYLFNLILEFYRVTNGNWVELGTEILIKESKNNYPTEHDLFAFNECIRDIEHFLGI